MGSRSLMIDLGMPCSLITPSTNLSATPFAVNGWDKVKKWVNLLNLSTTTKIVSLPWEVGNPSTKSRVISSQTWQGMGKGCRSPIRESVSVFIFWHTLQRLTFSWTAWCILG